MAGTNTEDVHLKEFKVITSEENDDCTKITKKCTLDSKAILENDESCKKNPEEEIDENETNAEVECENEGDGIDSTVEIEPKKPGSKNDTPCENVCDNCGALKSSNTEITPKESNDINERNTSKGTINVTGTRTAEERDNCRNDATTDEYKRRALALDNGFKHLKLNHGETSNDDDDDAKKLLKKVGFFALKTAVLSGAILGGTALIVPAIGFGALGVTGGSLAAAYQSAFLGGTIASGSAFATLQSIGMAGLSAAAQTTVVAGSAVASGAHTLYKSSKEK